MLAMKLKMYDPEMQLNTLSWRANNEVLEPARLYGSLPDYAQGTPRPVRMSALFLPSFPTRPVVSNRLCESRYTPA
jgi:hypothetical protein